MDTSDTINHRRTSSRSIIFYPENVPAYIYKFSIAINAAILFLLFQCALGQTGKSNVRVSGEVGAFFEAYDASGIEARQPDNTWHLYARPTVHLGSISLPFEFFLSSEDKEFRQPANRFSIQPSWQWGNLSLGDFHRRYSRFSLNGTRLRGGGFFLEPGLFRISLSIGENQRSLTQDNQVNSPGAFQRMIYAAKIGVGDEKRSYLDINFLKAEDDTSSAEASRALQAHENLVTSLNGRLVLFQRKLEISGEAAGAAFSRDLRASAFENEEIPEFLTDIFTPRLSSRFSTAFNGKVVYKDRKSSLETNYMRINPGFVSLGVPSLFDDQEEWQIKPMLRLMKNRWQVRSFYSRRQDNLSGEKRFTTERQRLQFATTYRPHRQFSISGSMQWYDMENDAPSDAGKLAYHNRSFSFQPSVNFSTGNIAHVLVSAYQYQSAENSFGNAADSLGLEFHYFNFNWTGNISRQFSLTSGFIYQDNNGGFLESTIQTFSLGGNARIMQNRLIASSTISLTNSNFQSQPKGERIGVRSSLTFRASPKDRFILNFRNMEIKRNNRFLNNNFTELRASLRYSRRL